MRPCETSPTPWPARPMRCSPAVTDLGDSTWSTRSTAPMSMPSSSEEVATRQGSSPDFSRSSTISRSSRASEPWWARAMRRPGSPSSPGQLVQPHRQPLGAAAVVHEDDRGAVLAHQLAAARGRSPARSSAGGRRCPAQALADQVAAAGGGADAATRGRSRRARRARACPRPAPGSSGRAACACRCRRSCTRGPAPTRKRPTSSSGRWVADRPIRCSGRPARCSSRSSVSARCAPRLVRATAWISSTITHSASDEELARPRGEHQVERLGRGDQHVGRLAQHRLALLLGRVAGADRHRRCRRRCP